MTPEESTKKICQQRLPKASFWRWKHLSAPACLGPDCMAWRWEKPRDYHGNLIDGGGLPRTEGYCGLAGRPE